MATFDYLLKATDYHIYLHKVLPPGKTTMAIVTLMPYEWVAEWNNNRVKKRGDEYESIKKTFGHKAIEQACNIFPSIKVSLHIYLFNQLSFLKFL